MDLQAAVSTIMSTDLKCVEPENEIKLVHKIFAEYRIHHVPVVHDKKVIGIVSKSDFLYFLRGYTRNDVDRFVEEARLRAFKVEEIMVKEVEVIKEEEPIEKAVDVLSENRFRCLPVLNKKNDIVGIVTTHDIVDLIKRCKGSIESEPK